jgi:hemerythrin superfamily protein
MDITDLIMSDHQRQRTLFVLLDEAARHDPAALGPIWRSLEVLLEVHAQIEETLFYPRLLQELSGTEDETKDAIGATTTRSGPASGEHARRR